MGSENMRDCIIVGAGISGLGVAARLAMQGKDILVLEKAQRVGGTRPPCTGAVT